MAHLTHRPPALLSPRAWPPLSSHGAAVARCGAKTIPEGGLFSQPRLYHHGALLVGDSASNGARLKGVHMATKSGMIAAEALLAAHEADDFSADTLRAAQEIYERSWAYLEHRADRNFHAAWK